MDAADDSFLGKEMQDTQSVNPYAAPAVDVGGAAAGDERASEFRLRLFSAQGRIGRVRYLGYSIGLTLLLYLVGALVVGLAYMVLGQDGGNALAGLAVIVGYVLLLVIQIMLTIKRAHDFDSTGWMSLLLFVPLINLLFLFVPGTKGSNRFGQRTAPNSIGVILLACILPLVFVVGVLAAVAIPAYQDYMQRANAAAQAQQLN